MESRLLLSGNQVSSDLDYSIWNLESLQSKYAIISQGDALPSPSTSTSSTAGPAGADLDVSWVAVPDMLLSASDAQKLAYQQYREAMSQGIINFQQSSALYQQLQTGFSSDAGTALVPVYTIGIRSHSVTPSVGGLSDLFTNSNSIGTNTSVNTTPSLVSSLGSTGSSFIVDTAPILYNSTSAGLDDDVRYSGDFNRDGLVSAADYLVWRDLAGPSDMLAYANWKSHFGMSVADVNSGGLLGNDLDLDQVGALDLQPTITIDVTRTPETSSLNGPLTTRFDFALGGEDDSFTSGMPRIIDLNPHEPAGDALPRMADSIADEGLNVTIGPVTFTAADDANIAASGATLIIRIDTGSHQLVMTPVAIVEAPANPQSKADEDLNNAIDELLSDDAIIVSQSGDSSSQPIADATPAESPGATAVASADVELEAAAEESPDGESQIGGSAQDATANQFAEGGMIAVEQIVDAAVGDPTAAGPIDTLIAASSDSTELVGELSRVAVMELIDGQPEPGESASAADHATLIAKRESGNAPDSEILDAVQLVAEQASLAISMVSPVNTAFLATITNAASHAFAAVVNSELSAQASNAARERFLARYRPQRGLFAMGR